MTNEEWAEATAEAERIYEIGQNTSSSEFFSLVDKYYTTIMPEKAAKIQE